MFDFNPYSLSILITAAAAMLMGLFVLRRNTAKIKMPLMILIASVSVWCFGYFFELNLTGLEAKMMAVRVEYLGIPYIGFFWFYFVCLYTKVDGRIQHRIPRSCLWTMLGVLPGVATTLSVWTNSMHHLFYTDYGLQLHNGYVMLILNHGILFYLAESYKHLMVMLSCVYVIALSLRTNRLHASQAVLLLCCAFIPFVVNLPIIFNLGETRLDYTPVAMLFSVGIMTYLVFNRRIFDLDPVARNMIVEKTDEAIILLSDDGRVLDINPAAERIFSVRRAEISGSSFDRIGNKLTAFQKKPQSGYCFQYENKSGVYMATGLPLTDKADHYMGQLLTVKDVTQLHQANQKIEYLASYDLLTGLPNSAMMEKHMGTLLTHARKSGQCVHVWIVQLDNLKRINNTFGYNSGDGVLKLAVERLKPLATDGILARFQGDRFLIAVSASDHRRDIAAARARLMLEAFETPFFYNRNEYLVTVSIGISQYPSDGLTADELIHKASIALENAEEKGKGYYFCEEGETRKAQEKHRMVMDLHHALDEGQFYLVYQPIVDNESSRLFSVEALLRWSHPELGVIYPGTFIPLLVEEGLINTLGKWIIDEACRQYAHWRDKGIDIPRVNVNVSVKQFEPGDLVPTVLSILKKYDLDPKCLELEITETIAALGDLRVVTQLNELAIAGVRTAIDDFGSGYSSLTYLKYLMVNTIKIDKALSVDIDNNQHSLAIIKAVKMVCDTLDMDIVTEYIENQKQIDVMTGLQCHLFQGYYFSLPLEPVKIESFVRNLEQREPLIVNG